MNYLSKSCKIDLKQHKKFEEKQNNGFEHIFFQKGVPFFPSQLTCCSFSSQQQQEQKKNTFCENRNVYYNIITYHILKLTVN